MVPATRIIHPTAGPTGPEGAAGVTTEGTPVGARMVAVRHPAAPPAGDLPGTHLPVAAILGREAIPMGSLLVFHLDTRAGHPARPVVPRDGTAAVVRPALPIARP